MIVSFVLFDEMNVSLKALEETLNYQFKDVTLLKQAFTHSSLIVDHRNNERLEFLGDRVLGLVMAKALYSQFTRATEGELAARQAYLVSRDALDQVGQSLNLKSYIQVAKKQRGRGTLNNKSMVADACEALIAALFLEGGFEVAESFILRFWAALLQNAGSLQRDAKSLVQEWIQGRGKPAPIYKLVQQTGPDHDPIFQISAQIDGFEPVMGEGRSKREAEQQAAQKILLLIRETYG